MPAADLAASRPVAPPEPVHPKPDPLVVPATQSGSAATSVAPVSEPTAQEGAESKPQKNGNRFVRALGKINPFHKAAKDDAGDAAKTPVKKD
jgi:hypothetical protein